MPLDPAKDDKGTGKAGPGGPGSNVRRINPGGSSHTQFGSGATCSVHQWQVRDVIRDDDCGFVSDLSRLSMILFGGSVAGILECGLLNNLLRHA